MTKWVPPKRGGGDSRSCSHYVSTKLPKYQQDKKKQQGRCVSIWKTGRGGRKRDGKEDGMAGKGGEREGRKENRPEG